MTYGPKPRDISGEKFNRLFVSKFSHQIKTRRYFLCICDCGEKTIGRVESIISGHKKSCGCLNKEYLATGISHRTHGMRKTSEYQSWAKMHQRCNNIKDPKYPDYGGRGIKVCKRWKDFRFFFNDMGKKPSGKHSIGRENNNGNYQPKNCRWETAKQQANNRRKPKPRS